MVFRPRLLKLVMAVTAACHSRHGSSQLSRLVTAFTELSYLLLLRVLSEYVYMSRMKICMTFQIDLKGETG